MNFNLRLEGTIFFRKAKITPMGKQPGYYQMSL
jgi:hypothetical protein